MPLKLVHRPRVVRRVYPAVLNEIRNHYQALGVVSTQTLADEISSWEHQPEFYYEVKVTPGIWALKIKWNQKEKSGQIYGWVSEGTGVRGLDPGGKEYDIVPKKAKALGFHLPMITKTYAASGTIAPSALADSMDMRLQVVHAPGIYPRLFGKELYDHLRSSKSGSFRNVTEAAIKRAFRKLGIYVG